VSMRPSPRARLLLSLALCSTPALAQAPAPAPPPEAPAPPRSPEGALPPGYPTSLPPAAPPAPPAPAEKKPDAPLLRVYALIKPTVVFASDGLESFSQPNASAATAAGNPVLAAVRDEANLTFQAAQSRLGFWFDEKGPVRGQLEFDFIDFAKSSPTVAELPRVRIAKVEWELHDSLLLVAGQDWDLYAPINPHGLNLVAAAFVSGNTGFMRQQAKFLFHTDSIELAAAVGLPAPNNAAKANVPEFSRVPSFAARAAVLLGPAGRVGVSGIANSWRFAPDLPAERRALAGAAGVFGDLTPFKPLNLRFEGYGGRNLANLGTLAIGQGSAADDVDEVGGFVSAKVALSASHALYGLAGTARVLNPSKVLPSYSYPTLPTDGSAPAAASATLAGTGPGMRWNRTARVGYEYRHNKAVAVLAEGFWFRSRHVLNAEFDAGRFEAVRQAFGGELGLLFTM
ncbi:MAG TPA: hypothetical protein VFS00_05015, partial [Polyangiaceae bacterium]|nr:hypothetical protein [Polyangiaceae bacterium]